MTEKIANGFKGERAIIVPYNIRLHQVSNTATRQLYVTHIGYYPRAKHHFRRREGGTKQNILILCEEGKGWIEHNDRRYNLSRNQIFILPANESHAYGAGNTNPWSIYWMHFLGEQVDLFTSIIGRVIDMPDSDSSRYSDRLLLFEEIFQNLEMGYSPENLEYASFCLMHFLASIKYIPQFRQIKTIKGIDTIQRSILYMKDHLENKISLLDIAKHVGYSPSHFGNLFLEKTSYSPIDYYNQLKIQRACSYLQLSDLNIKEIAFRLGYFDPFHFSKAFKKEMDITPSEYRKKYK